MTYAVDLFGYPVSPRYGMRGRPRHLPTPALRWRVRQMHEAGFSQPAIASAIGISVPTLQSCYPAELGREPTPYRRRRDAADRARGLNVNET